MNNYLKKVLPLSILLLILTISCDNELDINAEYEDINIIYGVVDPGNSRQYIRINRAFLTEGNALVAASVPDSSNYRYKLKVTMSEYNKNGQLVNTYLLDTISLPKEGGAFNVGKQVYYYFDFPSIYATYQHNDISKDTVYCNPEHSFKLKVENPVTGDVSEAQTSLIPNVTITKPAAFSRFIPFTSPNGTSIEMRSVVNGKLYEGKFVFYYREVDVNNPLDTLYKEIDWSLGTVRSERLTGGEDILFPYTPYTFFNLLKARVENNPNVRRYHGIITSTGRVDVRLIISVGASELSAYIDANKPSNSIIQDRPIYTNIENGIGIFSSKRTISINYFLNAFTVDSLRNGSTSYLNFQ
jgi:hypothetical protein